MASGVGGPEQGLWLLVLRTAMLRDVVRIKLNNRYKMTS